MVHLLLLLVVRPILLRLLLLLLVLCKRLAPAYQRVLLSLLLLQVQAQWQPEREQQLVRSPGWTLDCKEAAQCQGLLLCLSR